MGRKMSIIFTAGIIILLFIILLIVKKNNIQVENIDEDALASELQTNNYTVLYIGEETKDVTEKLINYKKTYAVTIYSTNMNYETFNKNYSGYNFEINDKTYILFYKNTPLSIVGTSDEEEIFQKYLYNKIPESERNYKVLSSSSQYIKKVNSKNYTIAVFGEESCSYCTLYLNTINNVAKNKSLNIYYFDSDTYDEDEYKNIINTLDFTIPAECTADRSETKMSDGFDKPLTIITKNGQMVGCVLGYVGENKLIEKLNEVGVINE